jgi:hypothetical protein
MPWIIRWQSSSKPGDRRAEEEDRRREALAREIAQAAEALARWLDETDEIEADATRH